MQLISFKHFYREIHAQQTDGIRSVVMRPFAELFGQTFFSPNTVESVTRLSARLMQDRQKTKTVTLFNVRFISGASILLDEEDLAALIGKEGNESIFVS